MQLHQRTDRGQIDREPRLVAVNRADPTGGAIAMRPSR